MQFKFYTISIRIAFADKDAGVNGLVEYFLVSSPQEDIETFANESSVNVADGFKTFAINFPHQGQVSINYESSRFVVLL